MKGRLGLVGGYKIRFFIALPLTIVMFLVQHPMYASFVASHGRPNINGCPSSQLLGLITKKSSGYSQDSTEIAMSCNLPTGFTTDLSMSSNIVEVGSKEVIHRTLQVSVVRILMDTPKSTNVFGKTTTLYLNRYHEIPWVCVFDWLLLA